MKRHEIKGSLSVHKKQSFFVSRKASMQLSINAIVILVMAMAVLGIGLGLIRGVLAPAQDNLEDALGKVDLNEQATSTKPIANLPQTLRMKNGNNNELVVSFYNTGDTSQCNSQEASIGLSCGDAPGSFNVNALGVNVATGTAGTLIANVEPEGFTGSVPCKVQVSCGTTLAEEQAVFIDFSS
jgi:hypothetical protein